MGILDWFLKKNYAGDLPKEDLVEANVCPNCWGRQEYEDKYYEYVKDKQIDVNNKDRKSRRAFIEDFVEKNITGIHLKPQGAYKFCEKCMKTYK